MTIPVFVNKYQEAQYKILARACFSKASQVTTRMREDEGVPLSFYSTSFQSFKPKFIKYFNISKDCGTNKCVNATTPRYKTLMNGDATWFTAYVDDGQFVDTEGIFWGINNVGSGPLLISVDVNGYNKPPNAYGKDTFAFEIVGDKLVPQGAAGTSFPVSLYCRKVSDGNQGFGCMYNVMLNIPY